MEAKVKKRKPKTFSMGKNIYHVSKEYGHRIKYLRVLLSMKKHEELDLEDTTNFFKVKKLLMVVHTGEGS